MNNKDIYFEYAEDLADCIVENFEDDREPFVVVIGKFKEIKDIIKELMVVADVDFDFINIESPAVDNYEDEFVLSLWMNDDVLEIGCEKLKNKNGEYVRPCGDITFLFLNCSSKIVPLCEDSTLYYVDILDDDDCDEFECEHCYECDCCNEEKIVEYSADEDGDLNGFTASKSDESGHYSFSFYTTDSLNKNDIHSMLKEFGF